MTGHIHQGITEPTNAGNIKETENASVFVIGLRGSSRLAGTCSYTGFGSKLA
jgi:hypothetical protein